MAASQTLLSYTTLVQAEVDDTSAGAKVVIQNSIKEIYMEILRSVAEYLVGTATQEITAIVGTRTYTPTDFTEIYSVHYKPVGSDTFIKLDEMLQDEYLSYDINAENGTPTKYFVNGLKIELNCPCGDLGTIRVEYVAVPSLVNSESVIPDRYNNVVKLGACYRFFAYEKGAEAENYYLWYQQALRDMIAELSTRTKIARPKIWGKH